MLIKRDCTAGGERKSSKQRFIGLVFQAAVFSLSTAGSKEREGRRRDCCWDLVVGAQSCADTGPATQSPVILRWDSFQTPRHSLIWGFVSQRSPFLHCKPQGNSLADATLSANSRRLSDRPHVASVLLRFVSGFASQFTCCTCKYLHRVC